MSSEVQPAPEAQQLALVSTAKGPLAFLTDTAAFNHLWRVASAYAKSSIVPQHVRGHIEDCFILCQMAIRMDVDPFMLMQSCYVVHGRPGFTGQFAIARLNSSGKIRGTLKFEFSGSADKYGCRAWAIDHDTGERVDGPRVDWAMVKAERWNVNKALRDGSGEQISKWNTMPDLMFTYRAAAFFVRTNYPEVLLGMHTLDEIEDSIIDVNAYEAETKALSLREKVAAKAAEAEPGPEAPKAVELPFNPPTEAEQRAAAQRFETDTLARYTEAIKQERDPANLDTIGNEVNEQFANGEISGETHAAVRALLAERKAFLEKRGKRGERSQNLLPKEA